MVDSNQKTLSLAILAQAVYDILLDLEYPEEEAGEHIETAWLYLSGHAKLLRRLRKLSASERKIWMQQIQKVLEE